MIYHRANVGADDYIGPEAPLKGEPKILRLRTSCYALRGPCKMLAFCGVGIRMTG